MAKTRIVRMYCQVKLRDVLVIQSWAAGSVTWNAAAGKSEEDHFRWEPVREFELNEYGKACEYAMNLSMTKQAVAELVAYEEGKEVDSNFCASDSLGLHSPSLPS